MYWWLGEDVFLGCFLKCWRVSCGQSLWHHQISPLLWVTLPTILAHTASYGSSPLIVTPLGQRKFVTQNGVSPYPITARGRVGEIPPIWGFTASFRVNLHVMSQKCKAQRWARARSWTRSSRGRAGEKHPTIESWGVNGAEL